jgi:hypothetical protein
MKYREVGRIYLENVKKIEKKNYKFRIVQNADLFYVGRN